ncbi:MAG: SRPBCC family protein [Arcicella sp.]|jgi:uncharacterized protein YndB with AHSA1/START domain|nr:SRPBCC family protein [Arcicella sp.]
MEKISITVEAIIHAPLANVWEYWTNPVHIQNWTFASDEWHAPHATNDLRIGGKFLTRMEAKDGSMGFDFEGVYTHIEPLKTIEYVLEDGRQIKISFVQNDGEVSIVETFDAENENPIEMQETGWQMILDNFKKYAEKQ